MKTEQLRDELAILTANRKRQRCGMKPITIEELLRLDPIAYDEYTSDAQAVIELFAPRMRKVSAALDHAKSWRPFGEALAMHFNDVVCPVEQAVEEFPEEWRK